IWLSAVAGSPNVLPQICPPVPCGSVCDFQYAYVATRSCPASETWMEFSEPEAHAPSVVPRTVMAMGLPPRLAAASVLHVAGSVEISQPPELSPCASTVCALHAVTIRQSVGGACADWLTSTSKRVYPSP